MELRALAPALALATLTACSVDVGALTDMSSGTSHDTTTGTGTGTDTGADITSTGSTTDTPTTGAAATSATTSTTDPGTSTTTGDPPATTTGPAICGGGGLGPGDHTVMVDHDGMVRSAIVHVPPGYDPQAATPLVLNFHGYTGDAPGEVAFSLMNPVADAHGFIVVYPQGLHNSWNAGLCCGQAVTDNVDDIGFIRALVDALHAQLCLDARRIYAAGMSNGGYISHRLACEAADLIAAIGPVSATVVIDPCTPSRPVPVMMFNGTTDLLVPYDGAWYQSAPKSFADWALRDGCTDAPEVSAQTGAVTCETHDECDDGVAVTLCTVDGMGHCWPGNPVCPFGTPNTDINASEALWAFFSQFALP